MNDPDLFVLAQECASLSRQISELMLGPISDEAKRFIAQGFVIPAPEALAHAANVFGEVAKMPGQVLGFNRDFPVLALMRRDDELLMTRAP